MAAEIKVGIGADPKDLEKGLKRAGKDVKEFANESEKNLNHFGDSAKSVFKAFAGFVAVGSITSLGKAVLDTTAEFEKFGAVLSNTLGSKALSDLKLQQIQDFAKATPFSVKELTESFVKLANQGFKPTGAEMIKLGDLAASTGKSFDQLAEAILDAQVGEFERLKEFGVRAQDAGDKVIFTFKGVQTTVDKTAESIRNYITSLGAAEGVTGSMQAISKTLTGQVSNLGDAWDQMLVSIGKNTTGVFTGAISVMTTAINKLTEFNEKLEARSKFGIGSNAGAIAKLFNPLQFLVGESDTDKELGALIDLQKNLAKNNSTFIESAKSVKAFNGEISRLSSEANRVLANIPDRNLALAIKQVYQDAIKALQDGAKALLAERIKILNNGKKETGRNAIKDLPELPFIGQETVENRAYGTSSTPLLENKNSIKAPAIDFSATKESIATFSQSMVDFTAQITGILNNGLVSAFNGLGEAIGTALSEGANLIDAIGVSLLASIGDTLVQFGKLTIAAGVAALGLSAALTNPTPAGAAAAIAAGVALVAVGSAVKSFSSSVAKNGVGSGGGGSNFTPSVPSGFEASAPAGARANPSQNVFIPNTIIKGTDIVVSYNRQTALNGRTG